MDMAEVKESRARHWLSYRSEIKVLDCTIRDGGLMNDHAFDDGIVKGVYQACVEAGIDYMELGYRASKHIFAPTEYGTWKYCDEDDIRRIVGENDTSLKLSVMADAERTDYHEDILPREQSVVDMIRCAFYIHQLPTALDIVKDANDKGYETTLNMMAVSTVQEWELDEALELMAESEADAIYLSDSFGSFYSEQIQYLGRKYLRHAIPRGKQLGMHTHNNQQLAYANTIEAIVLGANMLDASMAGLGRGAGNCPMELLLGFLHNPKYRLRPVLECIRDYIEPLREHFRWGFDIPYMITGIMNQHPRPAMQFNSTEDRGDVVKFFDMMIEEE
jgi:4-hydroxy 2-oxovalerate aldolase